MMDRRRSGSGSRSPRLPAALSPRRRQLPARAHTQTATSTPSPRHHTPRLSAYESSITTKDPHSSCSSGGSKTQDLSTSITPKSSGDGMSSVRPGSRTPQPTSKTPSSNSNEHGNGRRSVLLDTVDKFPNKMRHNSINVNTRGVSGTRSNGSSRRSSMLKPRSRSRAASPTNGRVTSSSSISSHRRPFSLKALFSRRHSPPHSAAHTMATDPSMSAIAGLTETSPPPLPRTAIAGVSGTPVFDDEGEGSISESTASNSRGSAGANNAASSGTAPVGGEAGGAVGRPPLPVRVPTMGIKDFIWATADGKERKEIMNGIIREGIIARIAPEIKISILHLLSLAELCSFALVGRAYHRISREALATLRYAQFDSRKFEALIDILPDRCMYLEGVTIDCKFASKHFDSRKFEALIDILPDRCMYLEGVTIDCKFASKHEIFDVMDRSSDMLRSIIGSVPSGVISQMFQPFPMLVSLEQTVAVDEDLKAIARMCTNLQRLELFKAAHVGPITGDGIDRVIDTCVYLRELSVYGMDLKIAALFRLKQLKNLVLLRCQETNLTNEECKVIAHCCPRLEDLSLMGNMKVTSRGVKHIAERMRVITKLNICSTSTRKDIAKLLKKPRVFPRLRILRVPDEILHPCEEALSNRYDLVLVTTAMV